MANAALDLIIMGCWSIAAGYMEVDPLPVSLGRRTKKGLEGNRARLEADVEADTHFCERYSDLDNVEGRYGGTYE